MRPKLAYQAEREREDGVKGLKRILDPCLELIQDATNSEQRKLYFDRFVDFFEAILAYHKAAGGK
ncbi:type III-A CRISPR-associated protein Csm2 [Chloroflexi bacterium TSY]|nr:type III-A CRISPR-associated protein Csm2 [Chloroflexi bacterium TSY]